MNKAVTPKQLELTTGKTREELLLATAPHIDPESPAFKESLEKVAQLEIAEAATAVLGDTAPVKPGVNLEDKPFASWGPSSDDFDWENDDSIVLREQPATAIYRNPYGSLVIRQKRRWPDEEEDPIVVVSPESAVAFMEALAARARE